MVDVKKDEGDWKVILSFRKDECPYVFYPRNIHACRHPALKWTPEQDFIECTFESCPAKL